MAEFCFQCNVDMHFGPYSDFEFEGREVLSFVLCEGCGPTYVTPRGWCTGACECASHEASASEKATKVYENALMWMERRSGPWGWVYRLRDRLLGTPWEPGTIHGWKLVYNTWVDHAKRRTAGKADNRDSEGKGQPEDWIDVARVSGREEDGTF